MTEDPGLAPVQVVRVTAEAHTPTEDVLAVEEPLEIRVEDRPLAVVMRTPGDDLDLAAGFLLTEGLIEGVDDLAGLAHCTDPRRPHAENLVLTRLAAGVKAAEERFERAQRHFFAASSCGVCGKATIDRIFQRLPPRGPAHRPSDALLRTLPDRLRALQTRFAQTGGLHGAALFNAEGELLYVREDVGRHNAVDKVIGAAARADQIPLTHTTLVVSGRAGFEIVQKALMAGIPALVAVGAASSLADRLAREAGLWMATWARGDGWVVHTG